MLEELGLTRDILDRARRSRDARFDGKFFIAVTSTRIYCRSICPAKASNDANVRYYGTAAEAAAAGFRPCRRCRPETAPGSPAWMGTSAVVQRALRLLQDGALDDSSLDELALRLGVGVRHLGRFFTRHVGASPAAIAQTRRLHFAKQLLDETQLPITEVALASGFGSVRRFNDVFKAMYRRPPREIRKHRGAGARQRDDAEITLRLAYRPPYDWQHVYRFLSRRAISGVESVADGTYARAVRTASGHAFLEVRPVAGADALELRIRGGESADLLSLSSLVRRMFDLSADPAKITAALLRDPRLAALVAQRPGLRIPGSWDPFESGVRAIVGQQISVAAGRTLLARLVMRAGEPLADGAHGLTHLFPTPGSLARSNLEDLGIPRARISALQGFARAVRDGAIAFNESSERMMHALLQLPGVGPWTAGYGALRGLGEPDGFPAGDLILRQQASSSASPLTARELEARAELWRPFRGYAVMHLWEANAENADQRSARQSIRPRSVDTR
jgi:AraC family transcriptional regulator, regulatory protein of adaptative response / DNA-3-methyladenine glycosylase II